MWPTLMDGCRVHLRVCAPGSLREGDVVLFELAQLPVLHRIVGRDPAGQLLTRGDNRREDDPPIPVDSVLGRVEGVAVGGRFLPIGGPHSQRQLYRWVLPPLRSMRRWLRPVRRIVLERRGVH